MQKRLIKQVVLGLLCLHSLNGYTALTPTSTASNPQGYDEGNGVSELTKYFVNLGSYLGYKVEDAPEITVSNQLLDFKKIALNQGGDILYLAATKVIGEIVSSANNTLAGDLNNKSLLLAYTQGNRFKATQSALIDQQPLQTDPVSQAIQNILSTPGNGCLDYASNFNKKAVANCTARSQEQVPQNIFTGNPTDLSQSSKENSLPSLESLYYNTEPTIKQLNSNTLIEPLLYDDKKSTENGTSSGSSQQTKPQGLVAPSQLEAASNFIKYATSQVAPLQQPKFSDIVSTYTEALSTGRGDTSAAEAAKANLLGYFAGLRAYAAIVSVAQGNLYSILSKRLPQNDPVSGQNSSLALNEYVMATRRLNNRSSNPSDLWINQINTASAATVQKEMLALLAEINYQLYLNRQQQERMLLTQSMLLMQNARLTQPVPSLQTNS